MRRWLLEYLRRQSDCRKIREIAQLRRYTATELGGYRTESRTQWSPSVASRQLEEREEIEKSTDNAATTVVFGWTRGVSRVGYVSCVSRISRV